MHNFAQNAIKIINDYKNLIRRQLSNQESSVKLMELGLDRRLTADDLPLFNLLQKIRQQAKQQTNSAQASLRYSGICQFLEHIDEFLAPYFIADEKVHN